MEHLENLCSSDRITLMWIERSGVRLCAFGTAGTRCDRLVGCAGNGGEGKGM